MSKFDAGYDDGGDGFRSSGGGRTQHATEVAIEADRLAHGAAHAAEALAAGLTPAGLGLLIALRLHGEKCLEVHAKWARYSYDGIVGPRGVDIHLNDVRDAVNAWRAS